MLRKKKDFLNTVNRYNSTPNYQDKNNIARKNLFNNEYVKEQSKKIQKVGNDRDNVFEETCKIRVKEYKDFLGVTNLIRNEENIKGFNLKHYNKNVQKYYKLMDKYAKDQGWKNVKEKSKSQGLGNEDDLFNVIYKETPEYLESFKRFQEAQKEYTNQATALAKEMLQGAGVKKPTDRQIQTTIYALSAAYKKNK